MVEQPVGQLADETFGPGSYNPCSYVYNNPVNLTDPSGLAPGKCKGSCIFSNGKCRNCDCEGTSCFCSGDSGSCGCKKCTLIGSGGCVGKKPNRTKKCTYDCGDPAQLVIEIKCPPNVNKEPPCPGA